MTQLERKYSTLINFWGKYDLSKLSSVTKDGAPSIYNGKNNGFVTTLQKKANKTCEKTIFIMCLHKKCYV